LFVLYLFLFTYLQLVMCLLFQYSREITVWTGGDACGQSGKRGGKITK